MQPKPDPLGSKQMDNPFQPPEADLESGHDDLPLLPRWIRAFCWLFLVLGILGAVGTQLFGLFSSEPVTFTFLGFKHVGRPHDPMALLITALLIVFAIASYGLLWQRPWGLWAGLTCGVFGLVVVLANAAVAIAAGNYSNLPLEPFLQVPFIISLFRRRERWAAITA